jgi:hypothetical protein
MQITFGSTYVIKGATQQQIDQLIPTLTAHGRFPAIKFTCDRPLKTDTVQISDNLDTPFEKWLALLGIKNYEKGLPHEK